MRPLRVLNLGRKVGVGRLVAMIVEKTVEDTAEDTAEITVEDIAEKAVVNVVSVL